MTKLARKKIYRNISFNDERKWKRKHPLDDILQVGIKKAMGYVVNAQCKDTPTYPLDLEPIRDGLIKRGLFAKIVWEQQLINGEKWYVAERLWVGDEKMIQAILNKHKSVLEAAKWPTKAEDVFNKVCENRCEHSDNKEMYHLICKLFNSWCLFCEKSYATNEPLSKSVLKYCFHSQNTFHSF